MKHRRAFRVLLAGVVVIPIALCLTVGLGKWLAGPWIVQTYEDRMYDVIAAELLSTDTGQTQVVVTSDALTHAFSSLPSLGGIYPRTVEFGLRSGWLTLDGNTPLGEWMSLGASFEPSVLDGRVRLRSVGFPQIGAGLPGVSADDVRSALETGIDRALEDAGYRATGVTAENGLLTISVEAIPALETTPSSPANSATPERALDDRKEAFAHHQRSASTRGSTQSRRTI